MSKILYADKETIYQNPQIPANQKVQSGDMNSIKNAINQEGRYTPTTYNSANGQFTCQMVGNLEVGDTIQVILDLTSQDDENDNDIMISIDGGINAYNLVDTKKEFILKASDFEYLKIYLKAVFNGVNFVLLSPDRVINEITALIREQITTSSSGTIESLIIDSQKGRRLSIENGVIKIGEGISDILANLTMSIKCATANRVGWQPYLKLKKSDNTSYENIATARDICEASEYNTLSITDMLLNDVSAGDLLTMGWFKGTSYEINVMASTLTHITIKEVR